MRIRDKNMKNPVGSCHSHASFASLSRFAGRVREEETSVAHSVLAVHSFLPCP